jgi:hypothetical protein
MNRTLSLPLIAAASLFSLGAAAKLPPLSEEAQAKAAETAARTAWSNKVADYQLCRAMDRVAERYAMEARQAGKDMAAAVLTPPCADPGAFVVAAPPPKPAAEAAGAHSPAETAKGPPSGNEPTATPTPEKK